VKKLELGKKADSLMRMSAADLTAIVEASELRQAVSNCEAGVERERGGGQE
jgi:hypothetical protein